MRICVISDLHTRYEVAEQIINKERNNVDKFVFLGDYFDEYDDENDNFASTAKTAEFIQPLLHDEKFVFLIGNHDLHYIFNVPTIRCVGSYSDEKFQVINDILTDNDWDKLQWTYTADDWLFSHSGINYKGNFTTEQYDEILNQELLNVINEDAAAEYLKYPGGKFWIKTVESPVYAEIEDSKPYNQIFGHTMLYNWQVKFYDNYKTYDIDTHNQHYAIINTQNNNVDIIPSGYYHRYHRREIQWLLKTKQFKNL